MIFHQAVRSVLAPRRGAAASLMAVVGLDRLTGTGNPDDWIFRAERYFAYLGFPENDWIPPSFPLSRW
ncbi:hypothetical protein MTR67_021814 [Solanum verrucosum]|uniref:Uncharacterized protein n=1 Tax=Solanum verrucosum TaxID=315347 RepID=A0AAF0QYT5_SOLVR|nr:hypothetical protein MTR67_021814 [Solanum verrucosum]